MTARRLRQRFLMLMLGPADAAPSWIYKEAGAFMKMDDRWRIDQCELLEEAAEESANAS